MSSSVTSRAIAGPRFKVALLMVAASLGFAMVAGAATVDSDAPSLVVKYNSQSLTTDVGVQQLYRRILDAAKQVCPEAYALEIGVSPGAQACRARAVADAIQRIGNTRLASLYATRSKSG
jgi:UrcA family protein